MDNKMKKQTTTFTKTLTTVTLTSALLLTGCGSTSAPQTTASAVVNSTQSQFKIVNNVPYADEMTIQSNVLNECKDLGKQFSNSTRTYMQKQGFSVAQNDAVTESDIGRNLVLKINNANSQGAAGIRHNKSVSIQASLYEDGKLVDSYNAQRSSGGGMFGAFKSSCSVLNRCVTTLGADVAKWLKTLENKGKL